MNSTIATLGSISQPCERAPSRKLVFGLGEADVDADLARGGGGHQELQGDRGLAGAGAALEQMKPVAGETSGEDVIGSGNAGGRAGKGFGLQLHGW